jgi:glycine hydroxymethyltransferase
VDDRTLSRIDPEIAALLDLERTRQQDNLELIASENMTSRAVMAAQGSVLTNKYAEGYPHKRYYGGCEHVDGVEILAIERARQLFGAAYANVQPHSGSQANMAVYFALLEPGDTVLGMNLAHGGHLTHGSPANFSGRLFRFLHYGLRRETGTIDYEALAQLALRERPRMIVAGASAYPRIIDFAAFAEIARNCGALLMVDMAHIAGLVAAELHPSPVPLADVVTTTTHKTLRGPRGGLILARNDLGEKLNRSIFPGMQGGPLMHVIAAKAVALGEALRSEFRDYQARVVRNAAGLARSLSEEGLPLVSGGTDNHLLLADLSAWGINGQEAEDLLGRAGITVNKNAVPFDTRGAAITSGIRIGTPAVTTRGMGEAQMAEIAAWIVALLRRPGDDRLVQNVRREVTRLCRQFPIYADGAQWG